VPKQIHEVTDEKKLRRAVQTTQEFNRSRYDTFHVPGVNHEYGALGVGQNAQTFSHVQFPKLVDSSVYASMAIPEHWAKGNIKINVWTSTPGTSSTAVIELRCRGHQESNAAGQLGVDVIASTTTNQAYGGTANVLVKTTYEAEDDAYVYDWISWRVARTGTSQSDTLGADLDFYGVTIEWQPVVPTI
jgi:hypothetical protein